MSEYSDTKYLRTKMTAPPAAPHRMNEPHAEWVGAKCPDSARSAVAPLVSCKTTIWAVVRSFSTTSRFFRCRAADAASRQIDPNKLATFQEQTLNGPQSPPQEFPDALVRQGRPRLVIPPRALLVGIGSEQPCCTAGARLAPRPWHTRAAPGGTQALHDSKPSKAFLLPSLKEESRHSQPFNTTMLQ